MTIPLHAIWLAQDDPKKNTAVRSSRDNLLTLHKDFRRLPRRGIILEPLCGKVLDNTWETDHIVPLTEAKSFEDAERLNAIENLQPVHRSCHQMKTSREARR